MPAKRKRGRPPIKGPKRTALFAVRFYPSELRTLRQATKGEATTVWARDVLLEAAHRKLGKVKQ